MVTQSGAVAEGSKQGTTMATGIGDWQLPCLRRLPSQGGSMTGKRPARMWSAVHLGRLWWNVGGRNAKLPGKSVRIRVQNLGLKWGSSPALRVVFG
jgi:hypothetical protein